MNESDHGRRSSDTVIVVRPTGIACNLNLISLSQAENEKAAEFKAQSVLQEMNLAHGDENETLT